MSLHKSIFLCFILLLMGCSRGNHPQFSGYIEGENIYLASPFYGVLEKLSVQRGQQVKQGQLLFSLDSHPQKEQIIQIEKELAQAKSILADLKKPKRLPEIAAIKAQIQQTEAQIQLAQIRVTRYQKLFAKQASDKDSLDSALATLHQQEELKAQYQSNLVLAELGSRDDQIKAQQNQVDSWAAKLKIAQWELAQKTMQAPASGIIFDVYYRQGELVGAEKPVLSLLTAKNIHLEFFVPVQQLAHLKLGQEISFDCAGCASHQPAFISYISPETEYLPPVVYSRDNQDKLVFRILADMKDPMLFKPGQPVQVTL